MWRNRCRQRIVLLLTIEGYETDAERGYIPNGILFRLIERSSELGLVQTRFASFSARYYYHFPLFNTVSLVTKTAVRSKVNTAGKKVLNFQVLQSLLFVLEMYLTFLQYTVNYISSHSLYSIFNMILTAVGAWTFSLTFLSYLGCVYTGSPILIFFPLIGQPSSHLFFTNWSFDQSHQIFLQQIFFRADLISQRPISEKKIRTGLPV